MKKNVVTQSVEIEEYVPNKTNKQKALLHSKNINKPNKIA